MDTAATFWTNSKTFRTGEGKPYKKAGSNIEKEFLKSYICLLSIIQSAWVLQAVLAELGFGCLYSFA